MTQDTERHQLSKRTIVHTTAAMDAVIVRRDEPYRATDAGPLTLDLYYPPGSTGGAAAPAVLFVTGFPDPGAERMFGSKFKDMGSFVSWARLVAASGLVGITYANNDAGDVHEAFSYIRQNAASLGVDGDRIAVWACSGHAPNALALLMEHAREGLRCAVLAYPYTLDLDGSARVADAARQFRFATVPAGRSASDLPRDVPLLVVRAGQDAMPGLNDALDRFAAAAMALNLPVTLVNYPPGAHAFDLSDDSRTSHEIVRQMLAFLQFHL